MSSRPCCSAARSKAAPSSNASTRCRQGMLARPTRRTRRRRRSVMRLPDWPAAQSPHHRCRWALPRALIGAPGSALLGELDGVVLVGGAVCRQQPFKQVPALAQRKRHQIRAVSVKGDATVTLGLFRFLWMRVVASNKTPRGIVEIETLAAALPIAHVVQSVQRRRSLTHYTERSTHSRVGVATSRARLKTPQIQELAANDPTRSRGQHWKPIGGPDCGPFDNYHQEPAAERSGSSAIPGQCRRLE